MIVKLRTSRRLVFPALLNMHTYSSQLPTHTPLNSPIHSPHRVSLIECCDVVIVLVVAVVVVVVLLAVAVVSVVFMHAAVVWCLHASLLTPIPEKFQKM